MCQFSGKTDSFDFFDPNLPKNEYKYCKLIKLMLDKNDHPLDTMCANVQAKRTTLTFLAQICPKMGFGVRNLKI